MVKLTYYSHDCWEIESEGRKIIIDPFIADNPLAPIKPSDIKVDAVLVTHGHGDHLGDSIEISKSCQVPIISVFELINYVTSKGATGHPLHIGGGFQFDFGHVKATIAHHGAGGPNGEYLGTPCGYVITMGGKKIYHSGDTGLFLDMKLIGEMNPLDVALLPIGDNFTMGIDDAVKAVEFLNPKIAIPMHYDTFDVIKADPNDFVKKVKPPAKGVVVSPGSSYELG
jgi:L-ascorbate metabolism protein UlaG (beta-lactamase superfamily)